MSDTAASSPTSPAFNPAGVRTPVIDNPLFEYVLRLGDDRLILGHRMSEWCGHGPILEEDIAMSNIALDLIGHASSLLALAGSIEGKGRDEDALAYFREGVAFRNLLLVELPNGDFGVHDGAPVPVRRVQHVAAGRPVACGRRTAGRLAAKCLKEDKYHLRHSSEWVVRLGDGTEESHTRTQRALDALWRYTGELFDRDAVDEAVATHGIIVDHDALHARWLTMVADVVRARPSRCPEDGPMASRRTHGTPHEHSSAICSPRCRSWRGRTLARRGDHEGHLAMTGHDARANAAPLTPESAWHVLGTVMDPEVPVISVVELGIVRDVRVTPDAILVTVTPTYSGCPAMREIEADIREALLAAGAPRVDVKTVFAPAWTTDWIGPEAREKLRAYGIAPPGRAEPQGLVTLTRARVPVACPFCGSTDTRLQSEFGSTACKAIHVCNSCRQPFDEFKAF